MASQATGHDAVFKWRMNGTTASSDTSVSGKCTGATGDRGPCVSHDAWYSAYSNRTYVVAASLSSTEDEVGTDWDTACTNSGHFVNDGFDFYAGGTLGTLSTGVRLMGASTAYDPDNKNQPYTPGVPSCNSMYWTMDFEGDVFDWTHANSVSAFASGGTEVIYLSLKEWNQILKFNAGGLLQWALSADATAPGSIPFYKDPAITGPTRFADQHDVHPDVSGLYLYMLDNTGAASGARVLSILVIPILGVTTATIVGSWPLVDDALDHLMCPAQGSGEEIPGSGGSVLALCNGTDAAGDTAYVIEELTDADGIASVAPAMLLTVPDDDATFCDGDGPAHLSDIRGWYRAFPMDHVGDF